MKLYNGYEDERLARNYSLLNDQYQFNMGCGYLLAGKKDEVAVFDAFFRKVPGDGGFAIMAGLDKVIPFIENLKFDEREIDYFRRNNYPKEFIDYLKNFKFHGTITAIPDGTPVFPNEPLITVKAPIIEAQLLETCLLTIINVINRETYEEVQEELLKLRIVVKMYTFLIQFLQWNSV